MKIKVVENVLDANDRIAKENEAVFAGKGVYVINIMSAPGAGKTSVVECTIKALAPRYKIAIIEGDIQDIYDAERVAKLGIPVVQINTGGACHLDGGAVREASQSFNLDELDLLIVENVGNLVCPAEFNLGEHAKVMLLSTPEGADKPAKYPLMFKESSVLIINKTDLLPYVNFDMEKAKRDSLGINRELKIFEVSCKNEEGLDGWYKWLEEKIASAKRQRRE